MRNKKGQFVKSNTSWNKGKTDIYSKETKRKMSKWQKGRKKLPWTEERIKKQSELMKGNKINLGKYHSKETKRKMSEAKKGKKMSKITREKMSKVSKKRCGELASRWQGGLTPINKRIRNSVEFRLWREAVFARDNWTCQKCKNKGGYLHPHHIKNFAQYPELRFAINNGITFCKKCHGEFHKKFNKKNNNIEQINLFLNN